MNYEKRRGWPAPLRVNVCFLSVESFNVGNVEEVVI